MWELMQSRQPRTDVDAATACLFLADLLKAETNPVLSRSPGPVSHSDTNTETTWREVEAGEPPRPAKRHRPNGTTLAAEPCQMRWAEMAVSEQLASVKSSTEAWTDWYQSLRMQHGPSTLIPSLAFAHRRLKDLPKKLSRHKDRVEVARREHDATWADLEMARSKFQGPTGPAGANPVSGQPALGIAASHAVELREAGEAFSVARSELEKQLSSEVGMQNLLAAAELAILVESQREGLDDSLQKLQMLVKQPLLPEMDPVS